MSSSPEPPVDPVLERRERIRRLTTTGQRIGYLLFGLAVAIFVFGLIAEFNDVVVQVITGAIILGSIVLAPSIVLAYAVKAADTEDREQH